MFNFILSVNYSQIIKQKQYYYNVDFVLLWKSRYPNCLFYEFLNMIICTYTINFNNFIRLIS